jgi:hypothetical protein
MWAAGDAERERSRLYHFRESDKLRKQEKFDKFGKPDMMDLEAQMLSKIRGMDLEPKMMESLMADEEVSYFHRLK